MNGLTVGTSYKFKVQGVNEYGEGVFSDIITVLSATVPAQMSVPSSSESGVNVEFAWTAPSTNGSPITSYKVLLYDKSLTVAAYVEKTVLCDGSNAAVVLALKCSIPMSSFTTTLGYTKGDVLKAKVQAYNSIGWSTISSENADAGSVVA